MTEDRRQRFIYFLPGAAGILGIAGVGFFWLDSYRQAVFFALFSLTAIGLLMTVRLEKRYRRRRLQALTEYLEQINTGTDGSILQLQEDEFSHLQDEIYKTVTELWHTRERAVKAKTDFADNLTNIAHQLKTPITAAFLSLQLLEQKGSRSGAAPVRRQLERLSRLEEALLMLSRIDAGTLYLAKEKVDIYTALELAAENLEGLLVQKEVSVSIPEKGSTEIMGDLEWTMEAFMNLLKNCLEHSPQGGVIHCDYGRNPLYTEVRIWDEGEGFAPEDLPHLFERFYRGKRAGNHGIGIGLALARGVFEMENGMISARNLPAGGACFEIRIYPDTSLTKKSSTVTEMSL